MFPSVNRGFFLLVLATAPHAVTAQTIPDEIARLKDEVHNLRLEMLRQKAEFQQWKVQNLTSWLQQTQTQRQQAVGQAQASRQELAELEIATRAGAEDQTTELDGLKEKLTSEQLPKLESWLQSLLERESALTSDLHREGARLAETQQQIRQIAPEAKPPN